MKQLTTVNDDLQEVHTKFMINDLNRWSEELKMIDVETSFYTNFIQAPHNTVDDLARDQSDLLKKIGEIKSYNENLTHEFQEFSNKLEGIVECDDLQCETYYVNNHTDFKQNIEKHFSDYNLFKNTVFKYLSSVAER